MWKQPTPDKRNRSRAFKKLEDASNTIDDINHIKTRCKHRGRLSESETFLFLWRCIEQLRFVFIWTASEHFPDLTIMMITKPTARSCKIILTGRGSNESLWLLVVNQEESNLTLTQFLSSINLYISGDLVRLVKIMMMLAALSDPRQRVISFKL